MGVCSRCGEAHSPSTSTCPRTAAPVDGGPCGTDVDRYRVAELLGQGSFGAVYRARHLLTEQWVALKVLRRDVGDTAAFDRLVREARAAAATGSANIIRVFDCGISDRGEAFMAMELLDGCDLQTLVAREKRLSIDRAVDICMQVLEGLADAHARGIVHRDVKPANVFIASFGVGAEARNDRVKLLDFGISKYRRPGTLSPGTLPGTAMGTPGYMAPEQFTGAGDADPRADVYATAVILYELLAGRRPFEAASFEALFAKVHSERATPLAVVAPHVPPRLAEVVERGLARDPDGRWASARDFASALQQARAPGPVGPITLETRPTLRDPSAAPPPFASLSAPPSPLPSPSAAPAPGGPLRPGAGSSLSGALLASAPRARAPRGALVALAIAAVLVIGLAAAVVHLATREPTPAASAAPDPASPDDEMGAKKGAGPKAPKTTAAADDGEGSAIDEPAVATGSAGITDAGITIEEPRIVGELDSAEVVRVLRKALPSMQACRRVGKTDRVEVAVHVHPGPTITLAQPAPDNPGDPSVARCMAARFKEAAPGWRPGDSGIIFFRAALRPRAAAG